MRGISLLEKYGIDKTVCDRRPTHDLEDELALPKAMAKESLVTMEQLELTCRAFETLHDAGAISHDQAVTLEGLREFNLPASLSSYTPTASRQNYQVTLEGLFAAIGKGLKKLWEMICNFFRWLFGQDRGGKAEAIGGQVERDRARKDKAREQIVQTQKAPPPPAKPQPTPEEKAKQELYDLSRRAFRYSNGALTEFDGTLPKFIEQMSSFISKHGSSAPKAVAEAEKLKKQSESVLNRVQGLCDNSNGPSRLEIGMHMASELADKVLWVNMQFMSTAITEASELITMRELKLDNYDFKVAPPSNLATALRTFETELEKLSDRYNTVGVRLESLVTEPTPMSLSAFLGSRSQQSLDRGEKSLELFLEKYTAGWASVCKNNKAFLRELEDRAKKAAIQEQAALAAEAREEIKSFFSKNGWWASHFRSENAQFTKAITLLQRVVSDDTKLLRGLHAMAECTNVTAAMTSLKSNLMSVGL